MVRNGPRTTMSSSFFDNLARSRRDAQPSAPFVPSEHGTYYDGPRHTRRVVRPKDRYDPSERPPQHVPETRRTGGVTKRATPPPTPRRPSKPRSPTKFDDAAYAGRAAHWVACDPEFACIQKRKGARRWRARLPNHMQERYHRHAYFARLRDARIFANTFVRGPPHSPSAIAFPSEDTDATDDEADDVSGTAVDEPLSPATVVGSLAATTNPLEDATAACPFPFVVEDDASATGQVNLIAPVQPTPSEDAAPADGCVFVEHDIGGDSVVDDLGTVAALLGFDVDEPRLGQSPVPGDGFVDCALDDRYAVLFAHETLADDPGFEEEACVRTDVRTRRYRLSDRSDVYHNGTLLAHGMCVMVPPRPSHPFSAWWRGPKCNVSVCGERDGPFFVPLHVRQEQYMRTDAPPSSSARRWKTARRVLWADRASGAATGA